MTFKGPFQPKLFHDSINLVAVFMLCSTLNTGIAQKEKSSEMTIKGWDVLDNKPF